SLRPVLTGRASTQVCIIGAGFSGLATALELAERGYHVVVLEAARIGWGASGRNGGQIVNGYSRDIDVIAKRYGDSAARALGAMAFEGGDIIRARVAHYGIGCDLREGGVFAAFTRRQMRELEERAASWERLGHAGIDGLDESSIHPHVDTDLYVGGLLDKRGGHIHPLNLALGEAAALESHGGVIHESSPVTRIESGPKPVVYTDGGEV